MKEEELIRKLSKPGKQPFRVPDGYFDSLTERIMEQLPEQQPQRRLSLAALWRYAAAVVVVAGAGLALYVGHERSLSASSTALELYADDYDSQALDYAMLDNSDIETFLTEAY